jgi:hypothetical protein
MTKSTKRVTVYLDPDLHKALRLKAVVVSKTVSDLVNEAIINSLKMDRGDLPDYWMTLGLPSEIKPKPLRRRLKPR